VTIALSLADATVWFRLADLAPIGGKDVWPILNRALLYSPSDSSIWIRLGLESEALFLTIRELNSGGLATNRQNTRGCGGALAPAPGASFTALPLKRLCFASIHVTQ
jgi:hypothetical protein